MRAHSPDWRTGGSTNLAGGQVTKHCDAVERMNATKGVQHGDPLFTTCVIGAFYTAADKIITGSDVG